MVCIYSVVFTLLLPTPYLSDGHAQEVEISNTVKLSK